MIEGDCELQVIQEAQQGPPGPRGIDANTLRYGLGPPTGSVGEIGDWYINTETHYLFGPKAVDGWPTGISIIGPQGSTGMQGPRGNSVFYGAGAPLFALGIAGDFYIDTDAHKIFGPKTWEGWDDGTSLIGPPSGRTVLSGSAGPTDGDGFDGDFYLQHIADPEAYVVYGPKANGTWPAGVSLIGPQGPQGRQGATGAGGHWDDLTGKPTTIAGFGITDALLRPDATATITVGYRFTPRDLGNLANLTINPALGNYQYGTNVGAFTLAAPANDCAVDILITNGAGAGNISFSGFTVAPGNTGDNLTVTNGHRFIITILRINGVSTYMVKALQ